VKLYTEILLKKHDKLFGSNAVIVGIGSCFSQYVMELLEQAGFDISSNPNGIVYNSYSIAMSLERIVTNKPYTETDLLYHNNLWHSWEHHGSFSATSEEYLLKNIQKASEKNLNKLKRADIFILTPASSVVYCLKENDRIISNCHKYPGNKLYTKILSVEDNLKYLREIIRHIRSINKNCLIVTTLSPVRHYPGDLVLNARSKANLLSAIHMALEENKNTVYFPSYEIFLDELRDYRFCNEDMLHPNILARKIIFEKFMNTFFTEECEKKVELVMKAEKLNCHRKINS